MGEQSCSDLGVLQRNLPQKGFGGRLVRDEHLKQIPTKVSPSWSQALGAAELGSHPPLPGRDTRAREGMSLCQGGTATSPGITQGSTQPPEPREKVQGAKESNSAEICRSALGLSELRDC